MACGAGMYSVVHRARFGRESCALARRRTDHNTTSTRHFTPSRVAGNAPRSSRDCRLLQTLMGIVSGGSCSSRRCRRLQVFGYSRNMAEREGFEPSIRDYRIHTFQACAFSHSATSPFVRLVVLVVAVTCRCREGWIRKRKLVFSPLRGALRASNLPAEDFRTLDTGLPFAHFPSRAPSATRPPLRLFVS